MACGLQTLLAACAFGVFQPTPAKADLLREFSVCAGRLSAVMEDQWMFDGPASENTARELRAMVELIEAFMPEDAAQRVMAWRIDAKVAQKALLHQARFSDQPRLAKTAAVRANALAADCRAMILS